MAGVSESQAELRARWDHYRDEHPNARTREVAVALGVSEMELLASRLGSGVVRLHAPAEVVLPSLESLGTAKGITRNEACVIEKTGVYRNVKLFPHAAQVVGEEIDLRIFPSRWVHALAVEANGMARAGSSLQFFDAAGVATHKLFLTSRGDPGQVVALIDELRHPDQTVGTVEPPPAASPERGDAEVDRDGLLDEWSRLTDTHAFPSLLRRFGVTRTQALRLAEGGFSRRVDRGAVRVALRGVADAEAPIMVFVGNAGTIQIHTGPVRKLVDAPPWFNVMDPGFSLHLNEDLVRSAWVVEKPSEGGVPLTSLELYDDMGGTVLQIFALRKPGNDGTASWMGVLDGIATLPNPAL